MRRPSGTIATPWSQTSWPGGRIRSTPSSTIAPVRSRSSPASALTSVLLPAPFGPTTLDDLAVLDPEVDAADRARLAVERPQPRDVKQRLPAPGRPGDGRVAHHGVRARRRRASCPWSSTTMRVARPVTTRIRCSTRTIVVPALVDPAQDGERLVELGRVQAGEDLVEQQQRRLRRERAGQLEQLALVQVDLARKRVRARGEADDVEVLLGAARGLGEALARRGRTCTRSRRCRARSSSRTAAGSGASARSRGASARAGRAGRCAARRARRGPRSARGRPRGSPIRVDLPEPFGPTRPTTSPRSTVERDAGERAARRRSASRRRRTRAAGRAAGAAPAAALTAATPPPAAGPRRSGVARRRRRLGDGRRAARAVAAAARSQSQSVAIPQPARPATVVPTTSVTPASAGAARSPQPLVEALGREEDDDHEDRAEHDLAHSSRPEFVSRSWSE